MSQEKTPATPAQGRQDLGPGCSIGMTVLLGITFIVLVGLCFAGMLGYLQVAPSPVTPDATLTTVPTTLSPTQTRAPSPANTPVRAATRIRAPTGTSVAPTSTRIGLSPTVTSSATIYPAPTLTSPVSRTTLRAGQVETLTWAWGRSLNPDERFRVRITGPGGTTALLANSVSLSIGQPKGGSGTYQWMVDGVRVDSSGRVILTLSGPSDSWQITWQ